MIILKKEPEQVLGKHLSEEIGAPNDYAVNKKNNTFYEHDLTIKGDSDDINVGDIADMVGALSSMVVS